MVAGLERDDRPSCFHVATPPGGRICLLSFEQTLLLRILSVFVCGAHGRTPSAFPPSPPRLLEKMVTQLERGLAAVELTRSLLQACPVDSCGVGSAMILFPSCQEIQQKNPVYITHTQTHTHTHTHTCLYLYIYMEMQKKNPVATPARKCTCAHAPIFDLPMSACTSDLSMSACPYQAYHIIIISVSHDHQRVT